MKEDLTKLDQHYSTLPADDLAKGVYFFASAPPHDTSFLTTRLWDKYQSPTWREVKGMAPQPASPIGKKFMDGIRDLEIKAKTEGVDLPSRPGESDQMVLKRIVSGKRGKWTRFPPEVMNRRKNADGEWEDIPESERS